MAHQNQLKKKYISGDENIKICGCGSYFTAKPTRSFAYSSIVQTKGECTTCKVRKEEEAKEEVKFRVTYCLGAHYQTSTFNSIEGARAEKLKFTKRIVEQRQGYVTIEEMRFVNTLPVSRLEIKEVERYGNIK